MAELALGVLGLAGLFSATLDVWSFVDAGQEYALSFTRLRTRLDLQRTLFVNWGKGVGFGSKEGYHLKLDDPSTQPIVQQVLTEIYLILSESDSLALKYGVRMLQENEVRRPVAIPRRILSLGRSASIFRPRYEEFRLLFSRHTYSGDSSRTPPAPVQGLELAAAQQMAAIQERQRNSSMWAKARWAIRDESKMERLVCDLAELISGLRALTADIVDDERERQIAEQTVSDIDSVDSLQQLREASLEASLEASPLSVSVSERIRSLESNPSGTMTFFSARSRLSRGAVDHSAYGTSQPLHGSGFLQSVFSDHKDGRTLESASSGGPQRRTFPLEALGEVDAFAVDGKPTPSLGVYDLGQLAFSQKTGGIIPSPGLASPPVDPDPRPFETMLVRGPADTPYAGGQFRVQFWMGLRERAEMDGEEVTVCFIYVRFLTRICHPLVDADGYAHGRFFIPFHSAPYERLGRLHRVPNMLGRMLTYHHWEGTDVTLDGDADSIEDLESKARSWTKAYAEPVVSWSPEAFERGYMFNVPASRDDELPPVKYPSRMKLERRAWEAQGVDGTSVTLVGYPAVQTWEGQLMPEIRLSGKHPDLEEADELHG